MPLLWARTDLYSGRPTQSLNEHTAQVKNLTSRFVADFASVAWGNAEAQLHDIGKSSSEFQQNLLLGRRSRVDHSTAGGQEALKHYHSLIGYILAYSVMGHHAGLPDGGSPNDPASLQARLGRTAPVWSDAASLGLSLPAADEFTLPFAVSENTEEMKQDFSLAFFIRMLFSCLVDADRLDAERCNDPQAASARLSLPPLASFLPALEKYMIDKAAHAPASPVNKIRARLLEDCRDAANLSPGLFSLTAPTGSGKTLAAFNFALRHAQAYGLKRIFYIIPFLSIIEQTAQALRQAVGPELASGIIEHHSNFEPQGSPDNDSAYPSQWENWDAPVVITSSVRFFESLFAHRPGPCRRLHNLTRSVIILDEAQDVPLTFLRPCLAALNELAAYYGSNLLLTTATPPSLHKGKALAREGLENVREIAGDMPGAAQALTRVEVRNLGKLSDAELIGRLRSEPSFMCIVNTRPHARALFAGLPENQEDDCFHLSTFMYPAHRQEVLAHVRRRLQNGERTRLISTQLVEAGVDLDFPAVFRAQAGHDSLIQAAGRCNREGKLCDPEGQLCLGRFYIFQSEVEPPQSLRLNTRLGESVLRSFPANPLSLEASNSYFEELNNLRGASYLDKKGILAAHRGASHSGLISFREISAKFQFIASHEYPVLATLTEEAREFLHQAEIKGLYGPLSRRLQRYVINVPYNFLSALVDSAGLRPFDGNKIMWILEDEKLYDKKTGLLWPEGGHPKEYIICDD
ncbi:MAG: CRISPR-associated endonuclease Cas3'' [Desulfarculales bacterium]|jgi:CRISPR-associated endonuclease/helicase Cas3|nr:CRISPR-associated endonuclease Cas3'' [Desulfarculales bacterium]